MSAVQPHGPRRCLEWTFVPIGQMMRHGVMLDIVAFVVIIMTVMVLGPLLF